MIAFDGTLSSLAPSLLVLGIAFVLLPLVNPTSPVTRAVLVAATLLLTWRYIAWRLDETVQPLSSGVEGVLSWVFAGLETLAAVSATTAGLFLLRHRDRSREASHHAGWWGNAEPPRVDVYIATYNEERAILERTIAGARQLQYPNARIFVLDDGRRPWLAAMCAGQGIGYITRPDNAHAKAGNINHAFRTRMGAADAPDFIMVLDADFVPHENFITRALALFHDPAVGLVQTPQCFFNPDPIQHNLDIAASFPDEQRFFFDYVQPARDAWGTAICCGTSSIIRTAALQEIGGVPTESVTEDFLLTLRFSERGWRTVYLNEPLSEGLAPEGLQEYVVQRCRWCLGLMQIARGVYNPFSLSHRLGFLQRLSVADSFLYWTSTFWFRLAALLAPLLYWYFGVIVVNATVDDIISYFLPSYLASVLVFNWLSRGVLLPVLYDVSQIVIAWPLARASLAGLMPGGPRAFKVTAKGGDRSRTVIQWKFLRMFAALFALTLGGMCLPLVSDHTHSQDAGDGRFVILAWSLYNLLVLALAMAVCFERARFSHPLHFAPESASLRDEEGEFLPGWVEELSAERACVRGPAGFEAGTRTALLLSGVGEVPAEITAHTRFGYLLTLSPSPQQRAALLARLHSRPKNPGVARGQLTGIASGLLRLVIPRTTT